MRLADFVARTPTARLATPEDNPRILAFFDRAPMGASAFAVQYQRAPDFFHLLRWQSDRSHVFITVDEHGAVRSMATVSLRPGWVDDRPTTVGYLGDLRVAFDRASIRRWRRFYGELLACAPEIEELADCTHWYTAVIDDNRLARLAIGHERAGAPVHVPLAAFTMRNLVARLPGFRPRLPRGWRVRSAAAGDAARIDDFFERENRALPLGFRAELGRRLARWDGLSLGDFLVVEDGDELLACAAPWSPAAAKRTVVSRVPVPLALAGRAARIWPGRAPLRVPVAGEPLRMLYLTNLVFAAGLSDAARRLAARALVDRVFDQWADSEWHCLALCDFASWKLGPALRGYVQQTVPITVYSVTPPGQPPEEHNRMRCVGAPGFEMAMV